MITSKNSLSLKFLWLTTIVSFALSFFFTIFQMGLYAKDVLTLRFFNKKILEIENENKNLMVEFSRINSLSNLDNFLKDFERAKNVKYIKIPSKTIAER